MSLQFKQRITGTVAIIALVVIFVPMLFEEPVSNKTIEIQFPNPPQNSVNKSIPSIGEMGKVLKDALDDQKNSFNAILAEKQDIINKFPKDELKAIDNNANKKSQQKKIAKKDIKKNHPQLNTTEETKSETNLTKQASTNKLQQAKTAKNFSVEKLQQEKTAKYTKINSAKANNLAKTTTTPTAKQKPQIATVTTAKPSHISHIAFAKKAWSVQLGAFSNRENAFSLQNKLKSHGFKCYTVNKYYKDKSLTLVYVGPELSKDKATFLKNKLHKELDLNSMVVSFNIAK